jgi:hypothetical protein
VNHGHALLSAFDRVATEVVGVGRYRAGMDITAPDPDRWWLEVGHQLTATRNGINSTPPWDVVFQVVALLNNRSIAASVASFDGSGPSIWTVTVISDDDRLIQVRMKFDDADFDRLQEQNTTESANGTVLEAWVRRLSDIVCLDIRGARLRKSASGYAMPNTLDVGTITVTFRDGAAVDLDVDQTAMTVRSDRSKSDQFVRVLRERSGL